MAPRPWPNSDRLPDEPGRGLAAWPASLPLRRWQVLATGVAAGPGVCTPEPGRLDVFWVGFDRRLWHTAYVAGSWSLPRSLGGSLAAAPAAVSAGAGQIDVFAAGSDAANSLLHASCRDGSTRWQVLATGVAAGPGVCTPEPGRLDVFWVGFDRRLWHTAYVAGSWSLPRSLGGSLAAAPAAVSAGAGQIDVFAAGRHAGQSLSHYRFR